MAKLFRVEFPSFDEDAENNYFFFGRRNRDRVTILHRTVVNTVNVITEIAQTKIRERMRKIFTLRKRSETKDPKTSWWIEDQIKLTDLLGARKTTKNKDIELSRTLYIAGAAGLGRFSIRKLFLPTLEYGGQRRPFGKKSKNLGWALDAAREGGKWQGQIKDEYNIRSLYKKAKQNERIAKSKAKKEGRPAGKHNWTAGDGIFMMNSIKRKGVSYIAQRTGGNIKFLHVLLPEPYFSVKPQLQFYKTAMIAIAGIPSLFNEIFNNKGRTKDYKEK